MRLLLLLAILPEVCFFVRPVHPLIPLSFCMACWAQDRSLSLVSERPRSPNPCVGFTAVQTPVWRGRSGFKNPFRMIGGVHYGPQRNPTFGYKGAAVIFLSFLNFFCCSVACTVLSSLMHLRT